MSLALHAQPELHRPMLHQQAVALRRHMADCHARCGRWTAATQLAERVHDLVAPRFVTTVAGAAALLALGLGWL